MAWAQPALRRDQLVLFSTKLDDIIKHDAPVRFVDALLQRLDWKHFEATYDQRIGQPPIHPRTLCSVILFGLTCRIRASRKLEEALQLRADFRWLAHGMSIDHTTLSEFRRNHLKELRNLFSQVVLVGQEFGYVQFNRIGFDGTRVRANNRKTGTRTPEQLRQAQQRLQEEFDRLAQKADQEDCDDEEIFDGSTSSGPELSDQQRLKELQRMQTRVDAALAELKEIEATAEKTPSRLPITDPQSRFGKTKEGGFAPSYTPTATVDIDSGMIIDEGVIAQSNESSELMSTIDQVTKDYALDGPVGEVLADGLMSTGENLSACEALGVNLISPVPGAHKGDNPAVRDDLSVPVSEDQIEHLPTKTIKKETRFDKAAFVYDAERDVYWCPAGKQLSHSSNYTTTSAGKSVSRTRYRASVEDCVGCALSPNCLRGKSKFRQVDRGEHEGAIDRQIKKMSTAESIEKYSARRHAGERPFAVIKQVFGVRQFLTRGLASVRSEWCWASTAFNLLQMASFLKHRNQPP